VSTPRTGAGGCKIEQGDEAKIDRSRSRFNVYFDSALTFERKLCKCC